MPTARKTLSAAFVIGSLFPIVACSAPTTGVNAKPLWAALGYDVSGSVVGLPSLSPSQLDQLVRHLERRGGTIAFATIGSKTNVLHRLELQPVTGLLNERAAKASVNRRSAKDWREMIVSELEKPRAEKRTAFNCTMKSINEFLQESIVPADAEKVVVVWSDGKDTASGCQPMAFPSDVRILVTSMNEDRAKRMGGVRVERFESTDGILKAFAQ